MVDRGRRRNPLRNSYFFGRWLFLRLLGLVYLVAFVSLWVQVEGLVGIDGILPVGDYLDQVREQTGSDRFWKVPTLLWLGDSNFFLHLLCGGGVLLALALCLGLAPIPLLFLLWVFYLSLVQGGQTFLSFQWDTLLLEVGFCALFVAPASWRPRLPQQLPAPPRWGLWLMWFLFFKLMFLSGAVKPLSMDETWWKLTALEYHYWTQPLPNGLSWYAHHFPSWFQKLSVVGTYLIEIALPFLIFLGVRGRRVAAVSAVLLMLIISWTGNYGFFNLLTMVLCIALIDDDVWKRVLPAAIGPDSSVRGGPVVGRGHRFVAGAAAASVLILMMISSLTMVRELVRTTPPSAGETAGALGSKAQNWLLSWSEPTILRWIGPFRTINGYGLFRAMTTERPEIVVEGSRNGTEWHAYEFKWKPGDLARRPSFVAPHMPRLDWQMWFAALNPRRAGHWLEGLMRGIFLGSSDVLDLLEDDPFGGDPPRFLRLVYYRYHFSTPAERQEKGQWWMREHSGFLTPAIAREQLTAR